MKNTLLLTFFLISFSFSWAQTTADFENFNLSQGDFINNGGSDQGFSSGNLFLPNSYDETYDFWSNWAISATTDTQTPGFMNQFSAITGAGVNNSTTYAVSYAFDPVTIRLENNAAGGGLQGFYITNSTYAYLSMRDGDGVAKNFGGASGNDPDYFKLTIEKFLNGQVGQQTIEFYLADYRFSDNNQDYIIDEWTYIDLTPLGNADSLRLILTSTDNGAFGMNTPAYFCIDNFVTLDEVVSTGEPLNYEEEVQVFPNPTTDVVYVNWEETEQAELFIVNGSGELLKKIPIVKGINECSVIDLPKGMYWIEIQSIRGKIIKSFVKL